MSDWSKDCEDLFAAGRTIDEPSALDRQRVALGIAARMATGAAVVSLTTAVTATSGGAGTGGTAAAATTAASAIAKVGTGLSLTKVVMSLVVGVGAIGAVGVVTTTVVKRAHAPAVEVQGQVQTAAVTAASSNPTATWSRPRASSTEVPPVEDVPPVAAVPVAAPTSSAVPAAAPSVPSLRKMSAPLPATGTSLPASTIAEPVASAAPVTAAAPAASEDTASEVRLVRGIDDALRRHDVPAAERLLAEHDTAFSHGHFTEECAAARVLTRCDVQAACTFLTQHPRSTMRARIEEACAPSCGEERDPSR